MHPIIWLIVGAYVAYVLVDGIRRARGTKEVEGYFLANRSLPWWAVGLSVMATQLSAVTMIGTTGQGATDGLRFVQFYLRTAARDGDPGSDARAVPARRRRLHRVRVP